MILIKETIVKGRTVFLLEDRYRKVWTNPDNIEAHVLVLKCLMPGYILDYGKDYIDYKIVKGTPASEIPHTDEFARKIYNYCLRQIKETAPWAHGDWVLSNIIVDGDTMTMVDWDNVGCYSQFEIKAKLEKDLVSAFGIERFNRIKNDTASV